MLKEARGSSQLLQIRSFFYTPEQDLMIFTEICQTDLLFYLTETQFDNSMIRHCAEDVTRGISFLHNRNIIHNDVKIENIFVKFHGPQKHPSYVLGDFGLARKISESEGVEGPAGTWGYMPPEVYRQERRYGLGLDWFAFAAVIYLLKVRHEAFTNVIHQQDSDYPDKLIEQSITDMDWAEEFPRPSCGDPDFTLWDLIAKIFVVKPEARLGYFHDLQVKNHAYFVGTNWHAECSECTYH
ncbi:kinase-like domain-containing protein [Chytridium lagenaria]|nr:kinase-like domain-containing protein [Chytridium lagenaria]